MKGRNILISLLLTLIIVFFGIGIILLVVDSSTKVAAAGYDDISDNLIACWDFEEDTGTRIDAVGEYDFSDWTGDLPRGVGLVNYSLYFAPDGETNKKVYFDESSDDGLDILDGDFTIALWVKVFVIDDYSNAVILSDFSGSSGYSLSYDDGVFYGKFIGTENSNIYQFDYDLGDDTWHLVVIRVQRSTTSAYISIDGVGVYTLDSLVSETINNNNYLMVGGSEDLGSKGAFDTMTMWRRFLTSDEVDFLYNSASGRPCSEIITPPSPTATNTVTPTGAPTNTPTNTPTLSPSNTPVPSSTGSVLPTYQSTITPTTTVTLTPTVSVTLNATRMITPTLSATIIPSVKLKILLPDGTPASEVTLLLNNKEYKTDGNGNVTIQNISAGNYEVLLSLNGKDYSQSFVLGSTDFNKTITVEEISKASSPLIFIVGLFVVVAAGAGGYYLYKTKNPKS